MASKTVSCRDIDNNRYDIPITDITWRPSAYGITIHNHHVLLCRHFSGKFDLPGGGVDIGEDFTDAVARETMEETCVQVRVLDSLGMETSLFYAAHGDKKSYHSILVYYRCEYVAGEPSIANLDGEIERGMIEKAMWVSLESLDDLAVASTVDYRPYIRLAAQRLREEGSHVE